LVGGSRKWLVRVDDLDGRHSRSEEGAGGENSGFHRELVDRGEVTSDGSWIIILNE
jgi:hypothetical protein